jgi:hypothetical protein
MHVLRAHLDKSRERICENVDREERREERGYVIIDLE